MCLPKSYRLGHARKALRQLARTLAGTCNDIRSNLHGHLRQLAREKQAQTSCYCMPHTSCVAIKQSAAS